MKELGHFSASPPALEAPSTEEERLLFSCFCYLFSSHPHAGRGLVNWDRVLQAAQPEPTPSSHTGVQVGGPPRLHVMFSDQLLSGTRGRPTW